MIRIGLLSAAHLHIDSYAAQLRSLPQVALTGLWDDDAERRTRKAAEYGCPAFESVEAVLDRCDAVVICSENVHHPTLTAQAARAGRTILCEKPLATTPENARTMVDLCAEAGVSLYTAFPCRFSAAFQQLIKMVRHGDLGEILAVRGTNHGQCPFGWFVDPALSGGGAVMDHTVHVTDLLRVLLGSECASVFCEADSGLLHGDFDDTGFLTLNFENGVFATLDASWSRPKTFPTWGDVTLGVVGTKGFIELDMFRQQTMVYDDRRGTATYGGWGSDIDAGLIRAFIESVETGVPHSEIASGTDGLRAVEVVAAAYRSADTHRPEAVLRA
ncbi:MAG: Gfo/Idh/MocA family oxidoreductase [Capsulimonadales bacterium]|nr:Gfo/Idh/MocA family oxidoreductase [Capsulimonadales bacterium]